MDAEMYNSHRKAHAGLTYLALICLLVVTEVMSDGHVVKRSDDPDPLETVVARLSEEVTSMKAELQALRNTAEQRAAFLVNNDVHVPNVTANAPIRFQGVVLNIGQGYDPTLGVFTAPYTGVYIMSFQIYPYLSMDLTVDLVKNGDTLVRMRIYDQSIETSEATSLTVHAGAGDKFWVQIDHNVLLHSADYCFFSGTLVSPDA